MMRIGIAADLGGLRSLCATCACYGVSKREFDRLLGERVMRKIAVSRH